MLEIIGLTLCVIGFTVIYQLDKIRVAVEMTGAIERKRMLG